MSDKETRDEHPSYGMVGFFRSHGGNFNLFGSSVRHNNTISLVVCRGVRTRTIHNDWYHGRERLLELRLSQTQFAELLTTMNCGDGVPCTLEFAGGETMPPCEEVNKREEFHNEFKEDMGGLRRMVAEMSAKCRALLANAKPSKTDREELREAVAAIEREVTSNIPFLAQCFNETTEKVVTQAKGEIDAAFMGAIHKMGLKAIRDAIGSDHIEVPALEYQPKE